MKTSSGCIFKMFSSPMCMLVLFSYMPTRSRSGDNFHSSVRIVHACMHLYRRDRRCMHSDIVRIAFDHPRPTTSLFVRRSHPIGRMSVDSFLPGLPQPIQTGADLIASLVSNMPSPSTPVFSVVLCWSAFRSFS